MSAKKKILLIDDDEPLREALREQFELHEDFEAADAGTGQAGLEMAKEGEPDLIILDVGLPDFDGREVCKMMRKSNVKCPIIMLTGADTEADTILGLDSGANDYVIKPFKMGVLLARIRAHLRQHEASEDASFVMGPYTFRPSTRLLRNPATSKEVTLSDKECAILKFLYRAGDTAVGCDTLYSEVWDHAVPLSTHTLQTHIYRLRQKIERDPADPEILMSEAGGYRVVR